MKQKKESLEAILGLCQPAADLCSLGLGVSEFPFSSDVTPQDSHNDNMAPIA